MTSFDAASGAATFESTDAALVGQVHTIVITCSDPTAAAADLNPAATVTNTFTVTFTDPCASATITHGNDVPDSTYAIP